MVSSCGPERLAVACSVLAGVLFALTQALAVAPYASADEAAHIDYAFQVWHGRLPVFEEGLVFRPPSGFVPPVQWTAQHPPLYYLVTAPVVGPLIDAGRPAAAAYAARGVNVALLAVFIVAAWWSVRHVARPGSSLPAATAFVVSSAAWAGRLGGSAYNDMLAAVLFTVLIGLTLRSLRHGLSVKLVVGLSVVVAACALTRASVLLLGVVCVAFAVAAALLRPRGRSRWLGPALGVAATTATLAASGWFYARNLRLTGSLTGAHPGWAEEALGRSSRTLWGAATDLGTWAQLLDLFRWGGVLPQGAAAAALLVIPAAAAAVVAGRRLAHRSRPTGLGTLWESVQLDNRTPGIFLLAVVPATALAVQIAYTMEYGSAHARYLLPVLVVLSIPVAACLLDASQTALPAWICLVLVDFAVWVFGGAPVVANGYPALTGAAVVAGAAATVVSAAGAVLVARLAPWRRRTAT